MSSEPRTVLALDTSTLSLSLAVARVAGGGATVLAARDRGPGGPNHSVILPGLVDEVLAEAGLALADLDGIVVGLGPGAFTGLRVSLSFAKGLAYAARLPLGGASSLGAMALACARLAPEAAAIVPLLDARKGQVYAGFYRPAGDGIAPLPGGPAETVAPPEAVAARLRDLPAPIVLAGEGWFAYRVEFDAATDGRRLDGLAGVPETPPAGEVAALAAPGLAAFDPAALFALEPNYLRASEAEEKLRGPGGPGGAG